MDRGQRGRIAMRNFLLRICLLGLVLTAPAAQAEWDLELGVENRYFPEEAAYGQPSNEASVSGRAKYDSDWNDGADLLEFEAFYRWSAEDDERTHGDIQDLAWIHVADSWELRSGVRTVFWGVTEFQHLVDIINQSDLAERSDGEARLGQPMVNLSLVTDWGIWDFFALAGFRERTFRGEDGRPRLPLPVDTDTAEYESSREQARVDFAMRWTKSLQDWELGLSYFSGTSREPEFQLRADDLMLVPYYPVIDQLGVELQYIHDFWLWKLEALTRSGMDGGRYAATVFGFEYTFEGVWDTPADLGLVVEYNWDERGEEGPSYLENDLALGMRWAFNDEANSDLLVGVIYDPHTSERILSLEAHRRLGDVWKINLEALIVCSRPPPDPLEWLAEDTYKLAPNSHDDVIQIELVRYF